MDEGEGGYDALIGEIAIVVSELLAEHQALVDDGAAGNRDRIVGLGFRSQHFEYAVRYHLAADEQLALEMRFIADGGTAANEHLAMERLGLPDRLSEHRIIDRHIAPAEDL